MKKGKTSSPGSDDLRKLAEARLKKKKARVLPGEEKDSQRLLHELQVHQIELEIQNEELRQARDEVEAVLAQYADLYDFAPVGYFTFGRDSAIRRVNLTGASLLGAERQRLVKRRFDSYITSESRPVFTAFLDRVFVGQDKQTCEISLLGEDQPLYMMIEASAAASGDECRAVAIDITGRRQIELKLQKSKVRYKELVASANSAIIRMDLDGTILFFNEYAQNLFGYALEEILGKNVRILVPHQESSGRHLEKVVDQILLNPDDFDENVNENITKTGEHLWVSWRNRGLRDVDGNIIGNLAIGVDITAKKQAEEALKISETRYRRLFEAARDGILILDAETGQISDVNPALIKLLGYSRETFLGKKICEADAFRNIPAIRTVFEELQLKEFVHQKEFLLETKDGQPLTAELVGNAYQVSHHKVIQCKIRDISERVLMSEALQKSHEEMEQRVTDRTAELQAALSEIQTMKDRLEAENFYFRQEITSRLQFDHIIGKSDGLKYVLYRAEQVASTNTTVLVLGETGTGKELIAAAIHSLSPRKDRTMITVNCAALPENLIESELFGREKGAFTGADTRQAGRFEVADGSTLCLDEIGELPLGLQAKLLRVIQQGEFERLGSSKTIKVDVRIVATTNRDLEEEVRQGRFRKDLYYRLNVFPITVPPLRQRAEDIPLLAQAFIERYSRKMGKQITSTPRESMQTLQDYPWPGNVRELESIIERAVIMCTGPVLQLADKLEDAFFASPALMTLEEMERNQILKTLSKTRWRINGKNAAAEILGLHPSTLRARMHKLGISRPGTDTPG